MAKRPIFIPNERGLDLVKTIYIDFDWYPGFSLQQIQKSIKSLHQNAKSKCSIDTILEISSKSTNELGQKLSAFKLHFILNEKKIPVECVFQGSKVFEQGGPYTDIYNKSPKEAKQDKRIKESGRLLYFKINDEIWPLLPKTAFYDWLYLNSIVNESTQVKEILKYDAFSDIVFNPLKSYNTQAYSAALFVSLCRRKLLRLALKSPLFFVSVVSGCYNELHINEQDQMNLF